MRPTFYCKLRRLNQKYKEFSKTAGLPEQTERTKVSYIDNSAQKYGGEPLMWIKMGGIIETDRFEYDVHWFELDGKHYEEKLKGVKLR